MAATAAGLLALPVVFRLFRRLPDRGYAFARPAGLLLIGYAFWFLGSLGLLRNDVPSLLFAAALVGGLGAAWLGRAGLRELRAWLGTQRRLVWAVEALFLAAFALLAVVRAYTPEILGTEKPMEFMFINSILRSPAFPPHDAWLSGHAVSYYYYGYVLIAALARVTATDSAVAFNLGLALLFALAAVAAQGVTLNLIALARPTPPNPPSPKGKGGAGGHTAPASPVAKQHKLPSPIGRGAGGEGELPGHHRHFFPSLLGPLLLLVAGNFYGLAQLAFVNGWFADTNIWAVRYYYGAGDPANLGASAEANPPLPPEIDYPGLRVGPVNFWDWLDLKQTQEPPPVRDGFTWNVGGNWFFAARVVHDRGLTGREVEAIDEMPSFSFILGDMHPHVLALPFVILAIGLALEWLLWGLGRGEDGRRLTTDDGEAAGADAGFELGHFGLGLAAGRGGPVLPGAVRWPAVIRAVLACLLLGGLSFLNTWDFPIYLFLLLLALAAGLGLRHGWQAVARDAWRLALLGVALGVVSVLLYFPFYLTFQSQAGGILPNVIWPTRFQQLFVFFGPVMIPVTLYLGWLGWRGWRLMDRRAALWVGLGLVGALVVLVAALMLVAQASTALGGVVDSFIFPLSRGEALSLAVVHRLVNSLATIFPAVLIGLAAGLGVGALRRASAALPAAEPASAPAEADPIPAAPARPWRQRGAARAAPRPIVPAETLLASPAVLMALAMIVTGALLVLGPEWVYLRDNFGYRMNTLFKFYFQAWALWALAGAFGLWHLFQHAREAARWVAGTVASLSVLGSLVYTLTALYSVTGGFAGPPTLDGMAYFRASYPDDWAAIEWLRANVEGAPVVAEAVGGAYRVEESRIAMGTGLPTPMGWSNHEGQWRGNAYSLVAERPAQVQSLYQVRDWATAQVILEQYNIEYIVVGNTERRLYNPVYTPKFDAYMDTVFESGTLTIYRRKPQSSP